MESAGTDQASGRISRKPALGGIALLSTLAPCAVACSRFGAARDRTAFG